MMGLLRLDLFFFYKYLENWIKDMKLLFLDIGQQVVIDFDFRDEGNK